MVNAFHRYHTECLFQLVALRVVFPTKLFLPFCSLNSSYMSKPSQSQKKTVSAVVLVVSQVFFSTEVDY